MIDLLTLTLNPYRPEVESFVAEQFCVQKIFCEIAGGIAGGSLLSFLWAKAGELEDPLEWFPLDPIEAEFVTGLGFKELTSARKKLGFRKFIQEQLEGDPLRLHCALHVEEIQRAVGKVLKKRFPPTEYDLDGW